MTATINSAPRLAIRRTAKAFGLTILLAGGFLGYRQLSGNFHTVIENQVYRSAQPSGEDVALYAQAHGIRSIINLRGSNVGKPWYDTEVASAEKLGIAHYDFRMSASSELNQSQAEELIALMANAPKPLLIHCQAGADRSGLASALYLAAVSKAGEQAAENQISFWYGHISLPFTSAYAMDRTFEALESWLGFPDS